MKDKDDSRDIDGSDSVLGGDWDEESNGNPLKNIYEAMHKIRADKTSLRVI